MIMCPFNFNQNPRKSSHLSTLVPNPVQIDLKVPGFGRKHSSDLETGVKDVLMFIKGCCGSFPLLGFEIALHTGESALKSGLRNPLK